ncbi:hypothetical protein SAMN04489759_11250 [Sulfitobacter delicatus]|uniref:Uncharacterized protein n=1 Tax=Sulfitobacter delicatus TaxID=218672 RepID=A0A1G7XAG7_9RHOB|nr:hypothetical protein SAMN04489759_11250 [Sulfitobacter delicatus]
MVYRGLFVTVGALAMLGLSLLNSNGPDYILYVGMLFVALSCGAFLHSSRSTPAPVVARGGERRLTRRD